MYKPLREFPQVQRYPAALEDLEGNVRGIDLEWADNRISILGVSDGVHSVAVPWDSGREHLVEMAREPNTHWIGHSIISADWQELKKEGIVMPLDPARVHDTIIEFYLTNAHLCKTTKKSSLEEDEGEKKGRGFMNLGTMAAIYTDLPHWKQCREATHKETQEYETYNKKGELVIRKRKADVYDNRCDGPCPVHDPFGYCGIDTLSTVLAQPKLSFEMKLRGVDKLYPMHLQLADVLSRIRERGVPVNRQYIAQLQDEFERMKEEAGANLPFNPKSPAAIIRHFKARGITLEDAQEETIREEAGEDSELLALLEYKELGNGPDRWFGPRFLPFGATELHPSISFFTSTGRLMSSNPNIQNVASRRLDRKTGENLGKKIRRACQAPDGYRWVKADYKNAENRVFLYLAGYESIPEGDFHAWMRDTMNLQENDPFSLKLGGAREAAKSVVHGSGDYLEGIQLLDPAELRNKRIRHEIEVGARIVVPDWHFKGKVVTFTGINLARRVFGKATLENRRKANQFVLQYFDKFPPVRDLQKRISRDVEVNQAVITPHGYYLLSFGQPAERLKQAAAMFGSNPVAHFMKLSLLRADQHPHMIPIISVHDEIDFLVDLRHSDDLVKKWVNEIMVFETPEMPGFSIPADVSVGQNWADLSKLK